MPADARLLEVKDLHVRESVLTGESLPVEKTVADLPKEKHGVACSPSKVKERNPLRRSYHLNTKIPMYLRPQRFEPLGAFFVPGVQTTTENCHFLCCPTTRLMIEIRNARS